MLSASLPEAFRRAQRRYRAPAIQIPITRLILRITSQTGYTQCAKILRDFFCRENLALVRVDPEIGRGTLMWVDLEFKRREIMPRGAVQIRTESEAAVKTGSRHSGHGGNICTHGT